MKHKNKRQEVLDIPLSKIIQKENSRLAYDGGSIAELMVSMRQQGVLEPIGLRDLAGTYEIVFGNRRFTAATKLGWETIPAIIVDVTGEEDLLIKNAIENMQREDVSPAEQGRIFSKLLKAGLTTTEIAARIGVNKTRVRTALDMFYNVPVKFREKIVNGTGKDLRAGAKEGRIGTATARICLSISSAQKLNKEQMEELFRFAQQDEHTQLTLRTVARLLAAGLSLDEAISLAKETRPVSLDICVQKEAAQKLEALLKKSIHEICYDYLSAIPELGLVSANQMRGRTILRKPGGVGKNERGERIKGYESDS